MREEQHARLIARRRIELALTACGVAILSAWNPLPAQSARFEPLPAGAWSIVSRENEMTVLARRPERRSRTTRPPSGQRPTASVNAELLVFLGSSKPIRKNSILRRVPVGGVRSGTVPVHFAEIGGKQIAFNPGGVGPRMLASPRERRVYVFEQAGTIQRLGANSIVSPAVADVILNFDRHAMLAQHRAEGVYLLWAGDPSWSGNGRYLVYATNRDALLAGQHGQSIWLLDVVSRTERPLLADPAESFGALGWLGNTLLYTDGSGGISSVDIQSGKRQRIVSGFLLAVDQQGQALAYAAGASPENRSVHILQRGRPFDIPPAPAGYSYQPHADFSPNGNMLLLVARTREGRAKLAAYSLTTRRIEFLDLPGIPESSILVDRSAWIRNNLVLVTTADRSSGRERSRVVSIPMHRER